MTEAEYYKLTKPERDEWVTDVLLGGDGIIVNHEDYNTTMQVIEKMREDGCERSIDDFNDPWEVDFFKDGKVFSAHAEQLRDAVYLAAGRAKGVLS